MKINKELQEKYEEFLFEFIKKEKSPRYDGKPIEIFFLFRKIVLYNKPLCNREEFNYNLLISNLELTPEIIYLIEETFLDERFTWAIKKLLDILILKKIKISKKVVDRLCEYSLSNRLESHHINNVCYYIKYFKFEGYCDFFEKLIGDEKLSNQFMAWHRIKLAGEIGCLNCYGIIKEKLNSKNKKDVYYAKDALEKLNKLK